MIYLPADQQVHIYIFIQHQLSFYVTVVTICTSHIIEIHNILKSLKSYLP